MPWIDTQRSTFVSALENFWNGWANRRYDIVLIASGSATSWMADKLIDNQGGLHNRITRRLYLEPFTLSETEEYFKSFDSPLTRYDILQCYMFTGGIPFYLSLMNPQMSVAQNIDMLFFIRAHRCAGNMTNYTAHCLLMWIPISRLLKFCTTINTA